MALFVIGQRSTRTLFHVSGSYSEGSFTADSYLQAMDLSNDFQCVEVSKEDENRIILGDLFELTWTDTNIQSLDFSKEDLLPKITISTDKTEIIDDGVDYCLIKMVSSPVIADGEYNVPVQAPNGVALIKFVFKNGKAQRKFFRKVAGTYVFPVTKRALTDVRFVNQITINCIME